MGASEHGGAASSSASGSSDSAANASVGAAESLAPVADLALVDIISSLSENDDPEAIEIRRQRKGCVMYEGETEKTS